MDTMKEQELQGIDTLGRLCCGCFYTDEWEKC